MTETERTERARERMRQAEAEGVKRAQKANGADQTKTAPASRFKLVRFKDVLLATSAAFLVKGLIPREGLVVIWGPPKCGKSYWTFDLFMHVALGWEYRDRRTRQGAIVYVALEGERGWGARLEAFKQRHAVTNADPAFFLLTTRLNLVVQHDELIRDIRAQVGDTEIVAIVIDTLNRSIQGSESDDEDMSAYVKAGDTVREAFACVVAVVHHCGTDANRPRGHTSLTGAADAQLAVKRDKGGLITVTVEWMKDGADGDVICSRLETVQVGLEQDTEDPIMACVVVPAEATTTTNSNEKKITGQKGVALRALHTAVAEGGVPPPVDVPASVRAVPTDRWRETFYRDAVFESGTTQDAKRKAFRRAADDLIAAARVTIRNDLAWPS